MSIVLEKTFRKKTSNIVTRPAAPAHKPRDPVL